eukprot:COSAG06_NODE_3644_length_5081_cov_22.663990_9_plen_166_part_00
MRLHMWVRIDGLLLNPEHPRADLEHDLKAWLQTMHTECISQLAISGHGKESLLQQDASLIPALEAVAQSGLTQHGRELARTALLALSETDVFKVAPSTDGIRHIMISCEPSPHRIGFVRVYLRTHSVADSSRFMSAPACLPMLSTYAFARLCRPMGCAGHDTTAQ